MISFKERSLRQLGDLICGNADGEKTVFVYRSSSRLTEFFEDCDTDYRHDGSTRVYWVAETLRGILAGPIPGRTPYPLPSPPSSRD